MSSDAHLRQGLSLIELLAVVTIIGVLAALIVPRVTSNSDHAKEQLCQHHQGQLNTLLERYYLQNDAYATVISDLEGVGQELLSGTAPVCPITGAAYTIDPATGRVEPHTVGNHSP